MDLWLAVLGVLFIAQCCITQEVEFTVDYQGPRFFPGDTDATLTCRFSPIPQTLESINVAWWKMANGKSQKIALSSAKENASYIYDNAPPELAARFGTSTEQFSIGLASATIANISIADDAVYECEVENDYARLAKRTSFEVGVYFLPSMTIEDAEVDLDIRPTRNLEIATASQNNLTSMYDDYNETTTTPNIETSEDGNVTIAVCRSYNSYPAPHKFQFTGTKSGNVWNVYIIESVNNIDGTSNSTARLRIPPTQELDGETIGCSAFITSQEYQASSDDKTSPITVKYPTSYVRIDIQPSIAKLGDTVKISCIADGNPAPSAYLKTPQGGPYEVTTNPHTIRAKKNDQGDYTCKAWNGDEEDAHDETSFLKVEWMKTPKITGKKEAKLGEKVSLTCVTETNAEVTYKWKTKGKVIQEGKNGKLVLNAVTYATGGAYTCEASGPFIKATQHVLDVEGGCKVKFTKLVSSSPTSPGDALVQLNCTSIDNPPCQLDITSSNSGLDSWKTATHDKSRNKVFVQIKALPKQMTALNFTCTGVNKHGQSSVKVSLNGPLACCQALQKGGGLSISAIIVIIVVVILVVVAVPIACYFVRKRKSGTPSGKNEKTREDGEGEELNATEENQP